ncbi:hypothetical protein Metbo_1543 [Methanobacterium lacus]|uniref:DUF4013 domain-containing protein n=1 Tax=Methanobacterium lacus (strain AL-21) TaxID=877455 RepID=F0T8U5_METLA|nr:hypothetical protein [Methanobacterium lacus]ADZ09773.1 hypothetical protein Metbo_1543 [Methanobacterium lacus]
MDIKEIKSFELTPFTKMSASIYGVLGFVAAVVILVAMVIVQVTGVASEIGSFNVITGIGIPLIILLPILGFFSTIAVSFFSVILYNALVPRLGGIKLGMNGNEIEKIPEVSFALILAAISAIWAFIVGLTLAAVASPILSIIGSTPDATGIAANFTNITGSAIPTGTNFGAIGIILSVALIIGLPILAFVLTFISNAFFAIFYNYIVTRVAKINIEFASIRESLHEIKHIPVLPTALAVALVYLIMGIITGLLSHNYTEFISNFILYFIETALIAILYNYLAPKIGTVKLDLE